MSQALPRITIAALLTIFAAGRSYAQGNLELASSGIPDISLISLDSPKADVKFSDLFKLRGAEWDYFKTYAVLIANGSDRRIRALTIAWTITDSTGKEAITYSADSWYFLNQETVSVASKGQTLLLPSAFVNATSLNAVAGRGNVAPTVAIRGPAIPLPARTAIDEFRRAAKVTVSIDCLIFDDGHVFGPDKTRTVLNLETRDIAARAYAKRLKDASAAGEDLAAVLAGLASLAPAIPAEGEWPDQLTAALNVKEAALYDFWMARMARRSQQSAAPMQVIDRIIAMQPLQRFFR